MKLLKLSKLIILTHCLCWMASAEEAKDAVKEPVLEKMSDKVKVKSITEYQVDPRSLTGNGWMSVVGSGYLMGKNIHRDIPLSEKEIKEHPTNDFRGQRVPFILRKSKDSAPDRQKALKNLRHELDESFYSGDNSDLANKVESKDETLKNALIDFDFDLCLNKSVPIMKKMLVVQGQVNRKIEYENLLDRLRRQSKKMDMQDSVVPCIATYGFDLSLSRPEERLLVLMALQKSSAFLRPMILKNIFLALDPESPVAADKDFTKKLLQWTLLMALSSSEIMSQFSWEEWMTMELKSNPFLKFPVEDRKKILSDWDAWIVIKWKRS